MQRIKLIDYVNSMTPNGYTVKTKPLAHRIGGKMYIPDGKKGFYVTG